jgi:glycosyltransferase involved in cell wall biosynthesis
VVIANHPIQHHAPLFRGLAQAPELHFSVAFVELLDRQRQGRGFGVPFQWDVPLLEGYSWRVLETQVIGGTRVLRQVRRQVQALDAEVLLLTGWQTLPLVQLLRAARREGLRVLMRGESSGLKRRGPLVRGLHRALLRQVDAFLVIGTANRGFYTSYGVARSRMFDAPYFVDNARFARVAEREIDLRNEFRAHHSIPAPTVCFLFAGKFETKKHPEHLLEALARLRRRDPGCPAHVLLVGEGALSTQLRGFARSRGLPATFIGFLNQSEIAQAYVASDALVLPSDYGETWGLVVNEAMACGRPALVSDRVGCGPDLIVPGVTGARFPFGDVDALSSLLEDWTRNRERLPEMGRAAQERVLSRFDVSHSVAATVEATLSIVRRKEAREDPSRTPSVERGAKDRT